MTMGPTLTKECTACLGFIKERTIGSGNTFGARYWTDGKADFPMLPETPLVIKCPHCFEYVWLEDLNIIEEEFPTDDVTRAEHYIELGEKDYFNLLNMDPFIDTIRYLRMMGWWKGNDKRRHNERENPDLSSEEKENIIGLYDILDSNDATDRLMMAEIQRELGEYPLAKKILDKAFPEEFSPAVEHIKGLVNKGDPFVSEIHF